MPTPHIDDLIAKVQSYDPTMEASWLRGVYELADAAHDGQHRASGEDYIEHPIAVARILADMEMDRATIAAAILHDVVEDTVVTSDEVAAKRSPNWSRASRNSRGFRTSRRKTRRSRTCARCSWRWRATSA